MSPEHTARDKELFFVVKKNLDTVANFCGNTTIRVRNQLPYAYIRNSI